jgi:hypothetical protein
MNVGPSAILMIYAKIIWIYSWPILMGLTFTFILRNKIENKLRYTILSILICYAIHIAFEILFVPFFNKPLENASFYDAVYEVGLRLQIVTEIKLFASAILLFFFSKFYRPKKQVLF